MSKVTLKVEIDEEAYKIIMNTSVIANEEMLLKGSAKDLKTTEAMLKFIDAIHETTPLTECDDAVSRQAVLNKAFEIKTGKNTSAMVIYAEDIRKELPVKPKLAFNERITTIPMPFE